MLKTVEIENFKSAESLELGLGRVNVFIGENGAGKSTILEALTFAGAAVANQLNDTFLEVRGVRTTSPEFMRSRFSSDSFDKPIKLVLSREGAQEGSSLSCEYILSNDNAAYSQWELQKKNAAETPDGRMIHGIDSMVNIASLLSEWVRDGHDLSELSDSVLAGEDYSENNYKQVKKFIASFQTEKGKTLLDAFTDKHDHIKNQVSNIFAELENFTIYSPQNEQLRDLVIDSKLKPLGVYGEGLFKLLMVIRKEEPDAFKDIESALKLFGWYQGISLPDNGTLQHDELLIEDRYLKSSFNLHSVNEGFLYVLFYAALIVSKDTPKIFAIDNIDAALNPKLCKRVMEYIAELARKYDKQLFVTTQNAAVLDGINLNDDDQRLFVVTRNKKGHTKTKRITADKKPMDSEGKPLRLSEAMIRGYLGGLPKGF
ncbi:hypothetical protein OAE_15405 [Vibrio cyclitrophicus 1F289]|uniref:AAA family ATPase n=1 Tax=Vibrio cyclitrophicus TaxID=47951 RepID=UPI0002FCF525|nr:AAA family ATPase [Vibrio cyclitrophicus]OEF42255.1 hypothetical protein OAE_15405 [Vibrio cyclitrophicus 1F289]